MNSFNQLLIEALFFKLFLYHVFHLEIGIPIQNCGMLHIYTRTHFQFCFVVNSIVVPLVTTMFIYSCVLVLFRFLDTFFPILTAFCCGFACLIIILFKYISTFTTFIVSKLVSLFHFLFTHFFFALFNVSIHFFLIAVFVFPFHFVFVILQPLSHSL